MRQKIFNCQNLPNIKQKVGKTRKVLHFENEIEHKILVTYVITKVSVYVPLPLASVCVRGRLPKPYRLPQSLSENFSRI